jgi:hypothetical protein
MIDEVHKPSVIYSISEPVRFNLLVVVKWSLSDSEFYLCVSIILWGFSNDNNEAVMSSSAELLS